jgi:glutathione synthase/RimK-type ligase-like ATP-grasp enzyme
MMGRIGIFVNRQTLSNSLQLGSVIRFRDVAESMGHSIEFIFPIDIKKIPKLDALFIRARTDPMNSSYTAAVVADLHGKPVIDDPRSIQVCSDKVNMYHHLMKAGVSIPETRFLSKKDITEGTIETLFREMGNPLVLKEPSTSFSVRVEKVEDTASFTRVAKRFMKLSDWVVVERFIESTFDWRIGVLDGEPLYACKYILPTESFKIQASVDGQLVYCTVESIPRGSVPPEVMRTGLEAAKAIGQGLYGVDIKETDDGIFVIEVNDNPSLEGGEDDHYPDVYERIVGHLLREG